MPQENTGVDADRHLLTDARLQGTAATLKAYFKLSGPGWMQSALTLGGGSLAGSLYLGVLGGMSLLWIQPLAMVLGIIMLSAIGYVTLSTGKPPFRAINEHINPVLGWGWALATLLANIVWCLPQFALANGVLQQNLLPELLGERFMFSPAADKYVISGTILFFTIMIAWSYSNEGQGIKLFNGLLKIVVALIVICFVGVVIALRESLDWSEVLWGFIPDASRIFEPSDHFLPYIETVATGHQDFWTSQIVANQRDNLITAAATAVGINMTFLFPYSLLKRGWTSEFRGLVTFDLATGMFIPFLLTTSCVVIASASQYHTQPVPGLVEPAFDTAGELIKPSENDLRSFYGNLGPRLKKEIGPEAFFELSKNKNALHERINQLPKEERLIGAMLVKRDALALAGTIQPLVGKRVANLVFGFGVLGMAISTIIMLMTISGIVICEVLDIKAEGRPFRLSCLVAGIGVIGPFVWKKAAFALAVPTSVFGLILLPIAYLTFFLLMNQKKLLVGHLPSGWKRVAWNTLMTLSASIAAYASVSMVWIKSGYYGLTAIGLFIGLALIVQVKWAGRPATE